MHHRKLIAHGPSSLTIALPHKWAKRYNLRKGDVVEVEETDQGLRVNPQPSEHKKTITIDLTNHNWPTLVAVLTTVYRRAYDEITIRYGTAEEYQNISAAIRSLLGLAIMENRKGVCLVKSLPTELEQDFPTLFRRVFLILLQQLEDLTDVIHKKDILKTFYHRDADLNAIVNLAIRMINKGYIHDRFEELHLFHALLLLEECGDDITRFTIETMKVAPKETKELPEAIKKTHAIVRLLYDVYFQKKSGIGEFYKQYYLYWPDCKGPAAPTYEFFAKREKDQPVFYLRSIVEKIVHLAEVLISPAADTT